MMKCVLGIALIFFAGACFGNKAEEGDLFEGDILLSPDQRAAILEQISKREKGASSFAAVKSGLWKTWGRTDTIKYSISPNLARSRQATNAINAAIADYHMYTCIRFKKYSSKPRGAHLYFTTGRGCSSPVGKLSNGNSISLDSGCRYKGTVMHEIGHSLGFFHEQSRPDRDNYVTIIWNNIIEKNKFNFNKYSTSRIDSRDEPYDYNSMMHYGSTAFSKNGGTTIQSRYRIGQRSGFSSGDKRQLNKMYC